LNGQAFSKPTAAQPLGPRFEPAVVAALYLVLTLLAWGLLATDRGLFQDDTALLAWSHVLRDFLHRAFIHYGNTTRFLVAWPYALALLTSWPRLALQLLYGAVWLGIGVAARAVARQLFPESPWLAFVAGGLTLCASADYLTNSLVASSYNLSVLAFLLAVLCLLKWYRGASWAWLAAAVLALNASVWMTDAAFAALFAVPGFLVAGDGWRWRRRQLVAAVAWYTAAAPYLLWFLHLFLTGSYVRQALRPMSWGARVFHLARLVAWNFTPWQWLVRPNWVAAPAPLLSTGFRTAVAGIGTGLFVAAACCLRPAPSPAGERSSPIDSPRFRATLLACLLMGVAANVIFVSAPIAESYYRTHLLSRVWASILVAAIGWQLLSKRRTALAITILGVFVFCGLYSAIERQDYYLGYWRQQRSELRSIVEQVPGLRPEATLVLLRPALPTDSYIATEVPYLARSWFTLLCRGAYRSQVWSQRPQQGLGCTFGGGSLTCTNPPEAPATVPLRNLVLMRFDPRRHRYELLRSIPADLVAGAALGPRELAAYDPASMIVDRALSPLAHDLLYARETTSRLLGI
jgi:hypothetical protein